MIYHTISPINVALCCGPSGHERRARCCIEVWGGWLFLRLIWSHPFLWFRTFWLFLYRMNASIFWARIVWTHVKRHVQPSIFWKVSCFQIIWMVLGFERSWELDQRNMVLQPSRVGMLVIPPSKEKGLITDKGFIYLRISGVL